MSTATDVDVLAPLPASISVQRYLDQNRVRVRFQTRAGLAGISVATILQEEAGFLAIRLHGFDFTRDGLQDFEPVIA